MQSAVGGLRDRLKMRDRFTRELLLRELLFSSVLSRAAMHLYATRGSEEGGENQGRGKVRSHVHKTKEKKIQ